VDLSVGVDVIKHLPCRIHRKTSMFFDILKENTMISR